jgi:hypothetical protein
MPSNPFRRLNNDAPPGHPSRALLERLPGPHLTQSSHAFSLSLSTTVFSQRTTGWFSARPRRADAGGPTSLHLSHSTTYEKDSYISPSFGVHDALFAPSLRGESPETLGARKFWAQNRACRRKRAVALAAGLNCSRLTPTEVAREAERMGETLRRFEAHPTETAREAARMGKAFTDEKRSTAARRTAARKLPAFSPHRSF